MYRKYPKPKMLWHWEEIFLMLFLLTLAMQNAGLVHGAWTFCKIFLAVGYPYFMIRALLRRDLWVVLQPFRSWIMITMWMLFWINVLSGIHAYHDRYWLGFNARYLQLNNAIVFLVQVIKREQRVLIAFLAAFLIGMVPNLMAGTAELVTKKQLLKRVAQGTEEALRFGAGQTELAGSVGSRRILGFDGGPGEHAMHTVAVTGLFAALIFVFKSWFLKGTFIFLTFICMVNVAGTGSRTGVIGLAITIAVFIIFIEMRRKWLLVAALSVAVVAGIYIFDLPMARLLGLSAQSHMTTNFRIQQYRTAFNMFDRHKILGIGAGQFIEEYTRYQWNFPGYERRISVGPLHNSLLNQLAEGGLVGFFFLLLFLFVVHYQLYVIRIRSKNRLHRILAVGILAGFAGWAGGLMFYPSLLDESGWVLMGLTMGLWNIFELERRPTAAAAATT